MNTLRKTKHKVTHYLKVFRKVNKQDVSNELVFNNSTILSTNFV